MKKILIICTLIVLGAGTYVSSIIHTISRELQSTYWHIILRDIEGKILTNKWLPWGYMIPYRGTLSGELFDAIIHIEDKRFREHSGIDYKAKLSGIVENIKARRIVRGGSTITEQYIKNTYYRWEKRTIKQKIDEAISALWIEQTHTKDDILRGYLDNIYFGNNTYGLQSALDLYFGWKTPKDLSQDNMLDIITRIRNPNIDPWDTSKWEAYRIETANRLGWEITSSLLSDTYERQSTDIYPMITRRVIDAKRSYCRWEKENIQKWIYSIPGDICRSNSIDLQLSVSRELQDYSNNIIQKTLDHIQGKNVTGSAVYIYNPTSKKVLAYVGNRWVSTLDGDIDMITRRRSVGSILKPFIYLLALKEWAELESLILDDSKIYPTWIDGKVFIPQNYNPQIYGPIRLREALWNSLNSSTVRLSEEIGIGRIYDFFRSIELSLEHDVGYYWYGISLGTVELSLENIVESYSILTDTADRDVFLIEKALSDTKNRAKTFGISSILNSSLELPVKTGTSTDFRDNWVVSYHRDAIIGIWVGNTDGSPMDDVSWVTGAWPIWHTIAEYMIGKWLIWDIRLNPPTWITETLLCLDIRCLRKERTYMKNPESIKSRPLDNIYYEEDFVWSITMDEKKKWKIWKRR